MTEGGSKIYISLWDKNFLKKKNKRGQKMGTKLKVMLFWVVLGFALVLTLGLSAFVFALPNESFNLSGELSYEGGPQVVKNIIGRRRARLMLY